MNLLRVHLEGDNSFANRDDARMHSVSWTDIALLEKGTTSGAHSVAILCEDAMGNLYFAQTTWAIVEGAYQLMAAKVAMDNEHLHNGS